MADIQIKPTDWNIQAAKYGVKPGDRLVLTGGSRNEIEFHDLKGTADSPITVTAADKIVIKGLNPGGRVVTFYNCQFIRFTGGDGRLIEITGGAQAVDFREFSTNLEIDHLYIHDVGYLGIAVKTDVSADPKTWRGAFTLRDVWIHDNLVVGTKEGEGAYIGLSHYHTDAKEHSVENVTIENNEFRNIGADGIQLGATIKDGKIRNNKITNAGTNKVWGQASGIQANPGTNAIIENNVIDGCTSFGIIVQGRTDTVVRRNRVNNTAGGIMTVAREKGDTGTFLVENNTFTNISGNGVEAYSPTKFSNNVLQVASGALTYKDYSGGKIAKSGNFELIGSFDKLGVDALGVPTAASTIPVGVGYQDYVKPVPRVTKTYYHALIEKVTTDGKDEFFLTTEEDPKAYRKKIE